MVLIIDGNSEQVAHAWKEIDLFGEKKNPIFVCSRSKQPLSGSNNSIAPYLRTYFWVTIKCKYHAVEITSISIYSFGMQCVFLVCI